MAAPGVGVLRLHAGVRFAATWIGNAMGKGWLFAGTRDKDGTVKPLPDSIVPWS